MLSGGDGEHLDPGFVPGRKILFGGSAILFCLGIGEIAASVITIQDSGGYYIGGWYLGMVCVIASLRGFYLPNIYGVVWLSVLTFISFITSVIGTALMAAYYNFLNDLDACATYDNDKTSSSCNLSEYSHFQCYGDNDYYKYAAACSADYVYDNDYDDYSDVCSCVKHDDDDDCYNFTDIDDCNNLLDKIPNDVRAAYIIAIFCSIISVGLLTLTCVSVKAPKLLSSSRDYNNALIISGSGLGQSSDVTAEFIPNSHDPNPNPPGTSTQPEPYYVNETDVLVMPTEEVRNPISA